MDTVKKRFNRMAVLILLLACLAPGICARAEGASDYCGTWVGDGVAAYIWIEGDETQCRVVFPDGDEAKVWAYSACWYDAESDTLQAWNVTRTLERLDTLLDTLEELDWSLNDMSDSAFRLSGNELILTDEQLDAPVSLRRLGAEDTGVRAEALAYLGRWTGEVGEAWVEDHGVCWTITVTVPVDAVTSHRWTYTCRYDGEARRMEAVSISPMRVITVEEDGCSEIEENNYESLASFTLEDGSRLIWSLAPGGDAALERPAEQASDR